MIEPEPENGPPGRQTFLFLPLTAARCRPIDRENSVNSQKDNELALSAGRGIEVAEMDRGPHEHPRKPAGSEPFSSNLRVLAHSADLRSHGGQFPLDPLVAAIDVVDTVDHRLAARGQSGDDQAGAGP